MNDTNEMNRAEEWTLCWGLLLAIGLVAGGWALGTEIKATRLGDRGYVSVRGLAERTVKSDLAIWPIDYKEAGDDLPSLYSKTEGRSKSDIAISGISRAFRHRRFTLGVVSVRDNQVQRIRGRQTSHSPLHRRAANYRTDIQGGSNRERGAENHGPAATGHRVDRQWQPASDVQIYGIELHQTRHDYGSHAGRTCRGRPLRVRLRQRGRFHPAGEPGRIFNSGPECRVVRPENLMKAAPSFECG